jgi:hypothetical protein
VVNHSRTKPSSIRRQAFGFMEGWKSVGCLRAKPES